MTDKTTPHRKGKRGRPKGDPLALRTSTIGVRVSPDEHAALRTIAKKTGTTPAELLRNAALLRRFPTPPVPPVNREQYAELARLAANLNQLAKQANQGEIVIVSGDLLQTVAAEVRRLRQALIGVRG